MAKDRLELKGSNQFILLSESDPPDPAAEETERINHIDLFLSDGRIQNIYPPTNQFGPVDTQHEI
jgi:hypothetical protein